MIIIFQRVLNHDEYINLISLNSLKTFKQIYMANITFEKFLIIQYYKIFNCGSMKNVNILLYFVLFKILFS